MRQASGRGGPRRSDTGVGARLSTAPDARYVSVEALRAAIDAAAWAPVRLAGDRRTRSTSPRLPHAAVLHLAADAREALAAPATPATGPSEDRGIYGVPLDPDPRRLAPLLGADSEAVAGVVGALVEAGVLTATEGGGVYLSPALLGAAPRCVGVDWRAVALATVGSPSAWVAAHVLAEVLEPDAWTPVPRSALERALGCGVSGLRAALDRLASASVVERREQRGGVSVYRFTTAVLTRGGEGVAPHMQYMPRVPQAPRAALHAFAPPGGAAQPRERTATALLQEASGAIVSVGGVELELPAGTRVRVEIGADGRPILRVVGAE